MTHSPFSSVRTSSTKKREKPVELGQRVTHIIKIFGTTVVIQSGLGQTHDKVALDVIGHHKFGADRAFDAY